MTITTSKHPRLGSQLQFTTSKHLQLGLRSQFNNLQQNLSLITITLRKINTKQLTVDESPPTPRSQPSDPPPPPPSPLPPPPSRPSPA
ncbi:hypothetical protein HanIR_Chr09g0404421 [Helianthus annuus]|nr:hypothetical protein HanIR_Chr09g0404421 [Helianthus annuus]